MNSAFGIMTRKIRNGESLRTMAKRLDISAAFLSAMEVGRKSIPMNYCKKITEEYNLSKKDEIDLYNAICLTNGHIDISIEGMNDEQQQVCMQFARKMLNANSLDLEKIRKALMVNSNE